jgi:hypothetical protein
MGQRGENTLGNDEGEQSQALGNNPPVLAEGCTAIAPRRNGNGPDWNRSRNLIAMHECITNIYG